jgi:putative aldouronate transport system permease protein
MPVKRNVSDIVLDIFIYITMLFVLVVTLYPFLNILAISLNESVDSMRGGIYILPRKFTLENYQEIFKYSSLSHAFMISVLRTVIGTVCSITGMCMLAFTLSRKEFVYRKFFTVVFVLTMYVSGGLIPDYMNIRNLHLLGKFGVYILPGLINCYSVIVIRSFIDNLPFSLQESAKIDGANDFTIFGKIVMPLCLPVIATISLFAAVGQWNSWIDTYLYASSKPELSTLQYELMKVLNNTSASQNASAGLIDPNSPAARSRVSPQSIRMAITIVATVPILLVYPFVQKY